MKDLTNFKIIKIIYPFHTDELGKRIWDKMDEVESKWAIMLTTKGITDTGESDDGSWDLLFLDDKLQEKVEQILTKYEVPYEVEDQSEFLNIDTSVFTKEFLDKLNNFLDNTLTIDDVLDRIGEVGLSNITPFEKYYIDRHKDDE